MNKVDNTYEEVTMTQEELQNEVAINENELLKALTSERASSDTKIIEVTFNGIVFRFRIRPLSEREWDKCRERNTKYQKNRRLAVCVCRKAPTRPATIPA